MTEKSILAVSCQYGLYNAQAFLQAFKTDIIPKYRTQYAEEIADVLAGPDNENYIDSWVTISDNCKLHCFDENITYVIHENDGDIWLVPESEIELIPEN